MLQELLKDVLAWPLFVVGFFAVGSVLLRFGDFISDLWADRKNRSRKGKRK